MYNQCQNQNRGSGAADGTEPVRKRCKIEKTNKHPYPTVLPSTAEDKVSYDRNLCLLDAECSKPKPRHDVMKGLYFPHSDTTG